MELGSYDSLQEDDQGLIEDLTKLFDPNGRYGDGYEQAMFSMYPPWQTLNWELQC